MQSDQGLDLSEWIHIGHAAFKMMEYDIAVDWISRAMNHTRLTHAQRIKCALTLAAMHEKVTGNERWKYAHHRLESRTCMSASSYFRTLELPYFVSDHLYCYIYSQMDEVDLGIEIIQPILGASPGLDKILIK